MLRMADLRLRADKDEWGEIQLTAAAPVTEKQQVGPARAQQPGWPAGRPRCSGGRSGQSSQMPPVNVIAADPDRVGSRLAVPAIVVILPSW